jgi:tetratricopeptide (TPR) repeat protein
VAEITRTRPGLTPISHSNLIAIEQGRHVPPYDKILTLSLVFNIPTQLFEDQLRRDMQDGHAAAVGESAEELYQTADALRSEGHYEQALATYTKLLSQLDGPDPGMDREHVVEMTAQARLQAANCRSRLGLPRVAKEELEELLKLEPLATGTEVRAFFLLAETYRELGNSRLAMTHAQTAHALAGTLGEPVMEAKILNTLGNIYDDGGKHQDALEAYQRATELLEAVNDKAGLGIVLLNVGSTWDRLGKLAKAQEATARGVAMARETGDRHGLAVGLVNLSRIHTLRKQLGRAKQTGKEAKEIAQEESYPDLLFHALYYLWRVSQLEGRAALGRVYEDRLRAVRRKIQTRTEEVLAFDEQRALGRSES